MVRRWQLALWVLLGLVLTVVVLWDRAGGSTLSAGGDRTETLAGDGDDLRGSGRLPFGDEGMDDEVLGTGGGDLDGDRNMLRPTTTTTTITTTTTTATTTSSTESTTSTESTAPPSSASTSDPADPTTSTTEGDGSPTSTVPADRFQTVYEQDFGAGQLDGDRWLVYQAVGHDGWGLRRRSAVEVVPDVSAAGGHLLQITARMGTGDESDMLVSGGMKLNDRSLTYGRVSFRARVDPDPEQVTAGVIHLWPHDNDWPQGGEINVMSTRANRDTRSPVQADLHWVDDEGYSTIDVNLGPSDSPISASDWHVYTLVWTPTTVSIAVDNGKPVVLTNDRSHVPHQPLDLAIQLDGSDSPDRPGEQPTLDGEVRLQVDWVRVETLTTGAFSTSRDTAAEKAK